MQRLIIQGGSRLNGEITVQGAKNAALPLLAGCVLINGEIRLHNCPALSDVFAACRILSVLGARCSREDGCVTVDTRGAVKTFVPDELMREMRSSIVFLGAVLGRTGECRLSFPGGCELGPRPIDMHLCALRKMGVRINEEYGVLSCTCPRGLRGARIDLSFPSVGATENIMLAAVLAKGDTVIYNAAREPEICDLAEFLNCCGAKISGAGTDVIKIRGVKELHGCTYTIIPDMIEAGTFMIAAAATGGVVRINNIIPKHLESITAKLQEVGADVSEFDDYLIVSGGSKITKTRIKTLPYPGFPTDMHPQMTVLLCLADGVSYVSEGVYENLFRYVDELRRMGADIKVESQTAVIEGGKRLSAAPVRAVDLRAGVALVIAGLICDGYTEISDIFRIERGYDDIVGKLKSLGADIKKIVVPEKTDIKKAN